MTIDEAKTILGEPWVEQHPSGAVELHWNIDGEWHRYYHGDTTIQMDGYFTADQLEALAVTMRTLQSTPPQRQEPT